VHRARGTTLETQPNKLNARLGASPVEIVGVIREASFLKITVRFPGDEKLSIIPSLRARIRSPRQLTEYCEWPIPFL
jgi:hypothetical protein